MKCTRHTEHAVRDGDLVGRHFPDNNRWPEGLWEPCDNELGDWVYCRSHVRPHTTGWCTVPNRDKVPLNATSYMDAVAEARSRGFPIFGEESRKARRFVVEVAMTDKEADEFFEAVANLAIDYEPAGIDADVSMGPAEQ